MANSSTTYAHSNFIGMDIDRVYTSAEAANRGLVTGATCLANSGRICVFGKLGADLLSSSTTATGGVTCTTSTDNSFIIQAYDTASGDYVLGPLTANLGCTTADGATMNGMYCWVYGHVSKSTAP